jgi:FkbM family methyltransferase
MAEITLNRNSYITSLFLLQQQGINVSTVLDLGAAEGIFLPLRNELNLFPGAFHFFVDCMLENEGLYKLLQSVSPCDYQIVALSNHGGEIEIAVDPLTYNTHIRGVQASHEEYQQRKVVTARLDDIVGSRELKPPYFIRLDLQGAELLAMQGGRATLVETAIVVAELQIFQEGGDFTDFLEFMNEEGFTIFDLTDYAYYPKDKVLYQLYATFIRKELDYRSKLEWASGDMLEQIQLQLMQRRKNNIDKIIALSQQQKS